MLYAADPWAVIGGGISENIYNKSELSAASSFVRQAREYFDAAERASTIETRPLLYYYSFLNLGKAIAIARKRTGMVGKVQHGVAAVHSRGHIPSTAELVISASSRNGGNKSAVDELHHALEGAPVSTGNYPIRDIIAQSVVGHRMWREGFGITRVERFVTVDSVRFFHDPDAHRIWSRIYLRRDTLSARNRGITETLRESGLKHEFRAVVDTEPNIDNRLHTVEQINTTPYTSRPSDVVMDIVRTVRTKLWQTVTTTSPYRKFYLYLSPSTEVRMPQWLSVYSTFFWLGSLTRYQPVELLAALDGPLGPFFREFLETQPTQLLYIFASEIKRQDVTKAAIV